MTGDFSRWRAPNAKRRGYTGVLMQQGRLYTDSDWNENSAILTERAEDALTRIIGPSGTPKDAPGFQITGAAGGFRIGAGQYWVGGVRVENPADIAYADQGGMDLEPLSGAVADGAEMLIHLTLRKDQVSGLQDALLLDPALSGADTAQRERALWRVAILPVTLTEAQRDALIRAARCGHAPDIPGWRPGTGRMRAGTAPAADLPEDSDCLIPPDAGYLSQENQLYRVQISRGGSRDQARFVWSRENGSVEARLARNGDGAFILVGAREDEALGFPSGGWVEVIDDRNLALGTPGVMTRMTLADGIATFAPGIGDFAQMVNPRLRRWDHGGTSALGLALAGTPILLERGIEISFTEGSYVAGDAWMFEARAATGNVIWPPYPGASDEAVAPMNWGARHAALALARRAGNGIAGITDLRATFPALTCIHADDVEYDDAATGLGAENVQEAIEALAGRSGHGICTAVVRDRNELIAAVAALRPDQSARLCLAGGNFQLHETLVFDGLGHVVLQGAGPQTIVSVARGEAAFLFRRCASVRVADLSVNGGPNGHGGNRPGRRGALTLLDCGDASIERVRARARAGLDRAASCIASHGRLGRRGPEIRIRDCVLRVGQAQIGVLVTGASRAIIEDNLILPIPAREGLAPMRIGKDPALTARIARGLVRFSAFPENRGPGLTVHHARRAFSNDPITMTAEITEERLNFDGEMTEIGLFNGGVIQIRALPPFGAVLARVIAANGKSRITDPAEMRRHLRNLLREAAGNQGRAAIAGNFVNLLADKHFRLAATPYIAEGITIGGDAIDELRITGNRIEDANDGIRIAASGRDDPNPPNWRDGRPPNRIAHAVISGNTVTLNPFSSATPAHGIILGHAERATLGQNSVTMPDRLRVAPVAPHFGICQFGWRGPLLMISENQVGGMENGIAVIPGLSDAQSGIWRLRDNAAQRTHRAYILAPGVVLA